MKNQTSHAAFISVHLYLLVDGSLDPGSDLSCLFLFHMRRCSLGHRECDLAEKVKKAASQEPLREPIQESPLSKLMEGTS